MRQRKAVRINYIDHDVPPPLTAPTEAGHDELVSTLGNLNAVEQRPCGRRKLNPELPIQSEVTVVKRTATAEYHRDDANHVQNQPVRVHFAPSFLRSRPAARGHRHA